jgi:hypothetical protein
MSKKRRSKLSKSVADPQSRYWRNKADKLWSELVRIDGECAICGKGKVQAHHLIPRTVAATRHCLENGIPLCAFHHKYSKRQSAHGAPISFVIWLFEHRPEQAQWAQAHHWADGEADYKAAYERLVELQKQFLKGKQ